MPDRPTCGPGVLLVPLLLVTVTVQGASCAGSEESMLHWTMPSIRPAVPGSRAPARLERLSRAEEFNQTGVLQLDYQIRATLRPNNVSQFLYLSPKESSTLLVSPCSGPISWSVSYVRPSESDQHAEDTKSQTWPVKQMVSSSPLFEYTGAETRNFTIPEAQGDLYRVEMRPLSASQSIDFKTRSPYTVLLYATESRTLNYLPDDKYVRSKRHQPLLEFQQRWSRRKLIVSWNKSQADPKMSSYLLAVTSGAHLHPPTLCAAENILKKHPCPSRVTKQQQKLIQQRTEPEGLHCVRKSRLTLTNVKYDTTYHFTLYIMNIHNNVSSRVAMDSFKFQRKPPPITLQNGQYLTTNLRKSEGFAIFRYRPRDNTTTKFSIQACGACSARAKFRAPGYEPQELPIHGELLHKAPPLPPGKRFSIQLTVSQADLVKMSKVRVLAVEDEAYPYMDYMFQNSARSGNDSPWPYRTLRKCRPRPGTWCSGGGSALQGGPSSGGRARSGPSCGPGSAHSQARPCPAP